MPRLSSEIAQKLASYESRKVPVVKASYPVATTGAPTRDGGVLRAGSSKLAVATLPQDVLGRSGLLGRLCSLHNVRFRIRICRRWGV
jgi:hypothetical protein